MLCKKWFCSVLMTRPGRPAVSPSNSRFSGKQYTQFELVHTADRKRKSGAINRGEMYEIAQGYAGADCSPMPVFLSSDTTVICKRWALTPSFVSARARFLYTRMHVCACMYDVSVSI